MNIFQKMNAEIYKIPFIKKLADKNQFLPQLLWIIPLAIVMLFYGTAGYLVIAMLVLYVFYGFFRTPEKKDIKEVQILKPGEKVTPENEKKVREYCKDKAFAMALEQHNKNYKKEAARREAMGQDVRQNPYKRELEDWSAEQWNRLKITFEENLLKMYGLKPLDEDKKQD